MNIGPNYSHYEDEPLIQLPFLMRLSSEEKALFLQLVKAMLRKTLPASENDAFADVYADENGHIGRKCPPAEWDYAERFIPKEKLWNAAEAATKILTEGKVRLTRVSVEKEAPTIDSIMQEPDAFGDIDEVISGKLPPKRKPPEIIRAEEKDELTEAVSIGVRAAISRLTNKSQS